MKRELIIVGGGELARVIIEAERAKHAHSIIGFIDPMPCEETVIRLGVKRLGGDEAIAAYPQAFLVLGVGSLKISPIREKIVSSFGQNQKWQSVIHPSATVSPTAKISHGAIILAGCVICSGASIGRHSIVNIGAMIDHDVEVDDFVHVAPRAAMGGGSKAGRGSYIGMGASIRDHIRVRPNTMVGMGAAVTKEHPDNSVLVGVPAKPLDRKEPSLRVMAVGHN